jgi:hypothetical protein
MATLDSEIVADASAMSAALQADKRTFDPPQGSKSIVPPGCNEERANAIYQEDTHGNPDRRQSIVIERNDTNWTIVFESKASSLDRPRHPLG